MTAQERLRDLLKRWVRSANAGKPVAPAELCRDHPELIDELQRRIDELVARARHRKRTDRHEPSADSTRTAMPVSPAEATGVQVGGPMVSRPIPSDDYPDELGGYRLLEILGEGGMGRVYLADDGRLQRRVAIKVMRPEIAGIPDNRSRFLREAKATARIDNDHVVPIFQVGEEKQIPFLVMPLLKGETLDARLKREGKFSTAEAIRIAREMAEGLAAAHQLGLIHRDIKPANVWLESGRSRVKILDFGLAKSNLAGGEVEATRTGEVMGTPSFMAPEQARAMPVDFRADLFSLGSVLYLMTTGKKPFTGNDTYAILSSLALDTPEPPDRVEPTCPKGLAALIVRLLQKSPEKRPTSADAVADELRRLQDELLEPTDRIVSIDSFELPEEATERLPLSSFPRRGKPIRRKKNSSPSRLYLFLGVGGMLAALLVALAFRGRSESDSATRKSPEPERPVARTTPTPPIEPGTKKATEPIGKKQQVEPNFAAERRAADYVLSIGGKVRLTTGDEIGMARDLPSGPFEMQGFNLQYNKRVDDRALAKFADCRSLEIAELGFTGVSDEGMVQLAKCKNLTHLIVNHSKVTDSGLKLFESHARISQINLGGLKMTDAGLAAFRDRDLVGVFVEDTGVTDVGLRQLRNLSAMWMIDLKRCRVGDSGLDAVARSRRIQAVLLSGTDVTDDGMAAFADHRELRNLWLSGTKVTDKGLLHLKNCPHLSVLLLDKAVGITDASFETLAGMKSLGELNLVGTRVSRAKVDALATALPKAKIVSDGGVVGPK